MFSRILTVFTVLFLLVCSIGNAKAETDTIYRKIISSQTIHCGYAEWPPFMAINPNTGKVSGLMYDVWEMIGKKLGLKIEWTRSLGWGEITEAVKSSKIDAFCAGIDIWPDVAEHMKSMRNLLLSRPIFYKTDFLASRGRTPTVIPLATGEYQLKNMIDTALIDLINDGSIDRLIRQWNIEDAYASDTQLPK